MNQKRARTTLRRELPAVLWVHAMTWLKAPEAAALQAASKALREMPPSANSYWKARYLADFEQESIDDDVVATSGVDTLFRIRYGNRSLIEQHRRAAVGKRTRLLLGEHAHEVMLRGRRAFVQDGTLLSSCRCRTVLKSAVSSKNSASRTIGTSMRT